MKVRLLLLLEKIRSSYWLIPTLMLLGGAALAFLLIALDQNVETANLRGMGWIFTGGAHGARSLLSSVAGSVIAVAGTIFSITIAVLSMTSSQFGPRLLRGFLRDRTNQTILGTFVGTFLYCLLVLRTVRSVDEVTFVPHIAVTGGVVLAVASVVVLIFFIHHVSNSIQASHIIASVSAELEEVIDRLYPETMGGGERHPDSGGALSAFEGGRGAGSFVTILAKKSGYVQAVDGEALLSLAGQKNMIIRLERGAGQFVVAGCPLALLYPENPTDGGGIEKQVVDAYTLGRDRTAAQDTEFLLLQLVEIAVRALSPGINDPITALMCLDRLGQALCHLAARELPAPGRCDAKGDLRLITSVVTFEKMAESAFGEIHHYGHTDPLVAKRLGYIIGLVNECARTDEQRAVLRRIAARFATS